MPSFWKKWTIWSYAAWTVVAYAAALTMALLKWPEWPWWTALAICTASALYGTYRWTDWESGEKMRDTSLVKAAWRTYAPQPLKNLLSMVRAPEAYMAGQRQMRFAWAERERVFLSIARFARINRPINGYYMEFGCHGANTMRMAWRHFGNFGWDFLAFDSFEGLPEIQSIDKQAIWEKGKLATGQKQFRDTVTKAGMPHERLKLIPGFYDKTLTPQTAEMFHKKAAAIYVDCDLYASTVDVLKFIPKFLQPGTVVVFDDWDCFLADPDKGERRAWREFLEANPNLRFEEFSRTSMSKGFVFVGQQ